MPIGGEWGLDCWRALVLYWTSSLIEIVRCPLGGVIDRMKSNWLFGWNMWVQLHNLLINESLNSNAIKMYCLKLHCRCCQIGFPDSCVCAAILGFEQDLWLQQHRPANKWIANRWIMQKMQPGGIRLVQISTWKLPQEIALLIHPLVKQLLQTHTGWELCNELGQCGFSLFARHRRRSHNGSFHFTPIKLQSSQTRPAVYVTCH